MKATLEIIYGNIHDLITPCYDDSGSEELLFYGLYRNLGRTLFILFRRFTGNLSRLIVARVSGCANSEAANLVGKK